MHCEDGANLNMQSLRILDSRVSENESSYIPLRERGPFTKPINWEDEGQSQLPRALRSLSKIVDGGLCHRCGSCIGICPTKVLGLDNEEYPAVHNLSACTDCDLCVRVCPGDEFDVVDAYKKQFNVRKSR